MLKDVFKLWIESLTTNKQNLHKLLQLIQSDEQINWIVVKI